MSFTDTRRTLVRLADVLDLRLAKAEVLDRIAFYSGGHPALLYALVAELLQQLAARYERKRIPITLEHVEAAWQAERFREVAWARLLAPLRLAPMLRFALGFLAEQMRSEPASGSVLLSDLVDWLVDSGVPLPEPGGRGALEADVRRTLDELIALGLAERREREGRMGYRLVRSGVGHLVAALITEPTVQIEHAMAEIVAEATRR